MARRGRDRPPLPRPRTSRPRRPIERPTFARAMPRTRRRTGRPSKRCGAIGWLRRCSRARQARRSCHRVRRRRAGRAPVAAARDTEERAKHRQPASRPGCGRTGRQPARPRRPRPPRERRSFRARHRRLTSPRFTRPCAPMRRPTRLSMPARCGACFPRSTSRRCAARSAVSDRSRWRSRASSTVNGETATVSCTLVTLAVGQVGAATPRRDSRRVTFTLAKRDGAWVIVDRR